MNWKKWISLTWTLINQHYALSRKRYLYFRKHQRLWEPLLLIGVVITLVFSLGPALLSLMDSMLLGFQQLGVPELLVGNAFLICSLFGFFLGLFFLVSSFFFSSELSTLIPLPIKPSGLLSSKLVVVILDQMWISLVGLLPVLLFFGFKAGVPAMYWPAMVIVFLGSQVFPMAIEAIIILPLSRVIRFQKHRDLMFIVLSVVIVVAALGSQFFFNSALASGEISSERMVEMLSDPQGLLNRSLSMYPPAILAVKAMMSGGWASLGWLLLFISLNVGAFLVAIWLAKLFYYQAFFQFQDRFAKKVSLSNEKILSFFGNGKDAFQILSWREWRYFLRVPAFSVNGFMNVLIFPALVVLFATFGQNMIPGGNVGEIQQQLQPVLEFILPIGILAATLAGSMNLLSATAFSREGKMLRELKVLPVEVSDILKVKFTQVTWLTLLGPLAMGIAISIPFSPGLWVSVAIILGGLLCSTFLNLVQMWLDSLRPSLDWDNPQRAMKQNVNGLFAVLIVFGFVGLFGFLGYQLRDVLSPVWMSVIVLAVSFAGCFVFWNLLKKSTARLLARDN